MKTSLNLLNDDFKQKNERIDEKKKEIIGKNYEVSLSIYLTKQKLC